jgi:hypothetical protein
MAKKRFVWIEGALREIGEDNSAIIDGRKWYNFAGRWAPAGEVSAGGVMVMPDIAPYRSMIDGSIINSRSEHRAHLRAHGCLEVGNEKLPEPKREFTATRGLRQELIARING